MESERIRGKPFRVPAKYALENSIFLALATKIPSTENCDALGSLNSKSDRAWAQKSASPLHKRRAPCPKAALMTHSQSFPPELLCAMSRGTKPGPYVRGHPSNFDFCTKSRHFRSFSSESNSKATLAFPSIACGTFAHLDGQEFKENRPEFFRRNSDLAFALIS